jgi:hypothetical protein
MALFERLFRRGKSGNDPSDYTLTMARAMPHLQSLQAMHSATWKIEDAAWDVDLEIGTITFRFEDGRIVTAPVQVIGTYNTDDGTWLWGWDHPSVGEAQAIDANLVKAFGEQHGVADLTTRKLAITEDRAWEFTALACLLADAQGAYRGPSGPTFVFMTFGTITMHGSKKPPQPPGTVPDDSDWGRGLTPVEAPEAIALARAYEAELLASDQEFHDYGDDEGAFERCIAAKMDAYHRFWRRDDDYHHPISAGWPSDHDPARQSGWRAYALAPDATRVAFELDIGAGVIMHHAYDVRRFDDGLRIVDFPLRG